MMICVGLGIDRIRDNMHTVPLDAGCLKLTYFVINPVLLLFFAKISDLLKD